MYMRLRRLKDSVQNPEQSEDSIGVLRSSKSHINQVNSI